MNTLILRGRLYDTMKWVTQLLLPGLGTLYFALAAIWGFGYADQVVKTDVALCTFLGLLLGLSNINYKNDDTRFDGVAYVDRLDPQNNPDIMLKTDSYLKPPKTLHLRVQETAPPVGNHNQDEPDTPLEGLAPGA